MDKIKSKKYRLSKEDLSKLGKGTLIAIGGAAIIVVAEALTTIDFGEWTPAVVALSAVLINIGRKLGQGK